MKKKELRYEIECLKQTIKELVLTPESEGSKIIRARILDEYGLVVFKPVPMSAFPHTVSLGRESTEREKYLMEYNLPNT